MSTDCAVGRSAECGARRYGYPYVGAAQPHPVKRTTNIRWVGPYAASNPFRGKTEGVRLRDLILTVSVRGMQWLQSTFANRFNKLRGEHGHLFQGRYKALPVEPGPALGQVCDYLHLNPIRAGIVPVERLREYRHSSYWYLGETEARPRFLRCGTALAEASGWPDDRAGREQYQRHLAWQAAEGPAGSSPAYVSLSEGWALGSAEFKEELVEEHALAADARAWASEGARELREAQWTAALQTALRRVGRNRAEAGRERRSATWKLAVAAWMKSRTQVSNGWLSEQLALGKPAAFSRNLTHYRRHLQPADKLWLKLASIPAA